MFGFGERRRAKIVDEAMCSGGTPPRCNGKRSVPRWSPDGEWMMYTRRGGRYWWSIDWTGSEPTQVVLRHTRTGTEAFIAGIAKANHGDYTWTTNKELCRSIR